MTKTKHYTTFIQWVQFIVFSGLLFGAIGLYEYRLAQIDTNYQEELGEIKSQLNGYIVLNVNDSKFLEREIPEGGIEYVSK